MKKILVAFGIVLFASIMGMCTFRDNRIPTDEEMIDMAVEYDKVHGTDYADTLIEEYTRR